jgi:hypothetical protein
MGTAICAQTATDALQLSIRVTICALCFGLMAQHAARADLVLSRTTPPATQHRTQRARVPPIALDELLRGGTPPTERPVDDLWLGPGPGALPASNVLNGRLTLLDTSSIATQMLRDDLDLYRFPARRRLPPDGSFTAEYARGAASGTHRSDAVPVQEGLQITGDIVWELIFSTGVVWDEPDGVDRGWSRALLPFALSERNANCVHNGLLLVAFQQDAVSGARFQIT